MPVLERMNGERNNRIVTRIDKTIAVLGGPSWVTGSLLPLVSKAGGRIITDKSRAWSAGAEQEESKTQGFAPGVLGL